MEVDVDKLRDLYSKDHNANKILTELSNRIRAVPVTKVTLSSERTEVDRTRALATFKEFEKLGLGTLSSDTFSWNYNFIAVGNAAQGLEAFLEPLREEDYELRNKPEVFKSTAKTVHTDFLQPVEPKPTRVVAKPTQPVKRVPGFMAHKFRLRPDLYLTFQLPTDITRFEAQRLGRFVHLLYLEE